MPKLNWNCCEDHKYGESYLCCVRCKYAYHTNCLQATGYSQISDKAISEWNCPTCTPKRSNTPVHTKTTNTGVPDNANITKRSTKRMALSSPPASEPKSVLSHSEYRDMLKEIVKDEMHVMLTQLKISLKSILNDELKLIKNELAEMKSSINFINSQYDDFIKEHKSNINIIKELKDETLRAQTNLNSLTTRINDLEQRARERNLEIQCVPENRNENLITVMKQLGNIIGSEIPEDKILSCSRVAKPNRQSPRPRSIVVQFSSTYVRDSFLASVIKFNKTHPNDKLNTSHFGIGGIKKPIYVMEHLSPANKALHAATRIKAKEKGYRYVWIRNGRMFVRKNDSSDFKIVRDMEFLDTLK